MIDSLTECHLSAMSQQTITKQASVIHANIHAWYILTCIEIHLYPDSKPSTPIFESTVYHFWDTPSSRLLFKTIIMNCLYYNGIPM